MRRGIVYAGIFLSLLAAAVGAAVQEINSAPWLRGFHFQEANAEIPLFVERHGSTTLSLRKSLDYGLHRTARDYGAGLPTGSVEWSPDGASLAIAGDNETHLTFVTPSRNVLHIIPFCCCRELRDLCSRRIVPLTATQRWPWRMPVRAERSSKFRDPSLEKTPASIGRITWLFRRTRSSPLCPFSGQTTYSSIARMTGRFFVGSTSTECRKDCCSFQTTGAS